MILKIIILLLPWKLRRLFLIYFYKFEIDPTARIGFSWIYPKKLFMGKNSKITHFTVAINLEKIVLNDNSIIDRQNWITGFPLNSKYDHFKFEIERKPELIIGQHSAITKKHHIDCTNKIQIGDFTTIAGYNSQFLTHSINILNNRQESKEIIIGDFCFIGSNVVILGGSVLPNYSVLGSMSMLNKVFINEYSLYAGNPAREIKKLPDDTKYFHRIEGFVI